MTTCGLAQGADKINTEIPPQRDCVAIPFRHCKPFEYLRINFLKGACLHAEVAFWHAGVAISFFRCLMRLLRSFKFLAMTL
jgi:hypothetical protein